MDEELENAGISDKYKDKRILNILPHQYKKGQSGNPAGKPKGAKSMKTYVKEKLESMTEDEREVFLEGIDKKILWEMSEGKPKQDMEIDATLSGPSIIRLNE